MWEILDSMYQKTRIVTGYVYPEAKYHTELHSADYTTEKDSVTDGSFIPGQYRVNPYNIYGYEVQAPKFSLEYYDANASYNFFVRETGKGLFSYSLTRVMDDIVAAHNTAPDFWRSVALQRAYAAVSGGVGTYGTELGEFKETLQMLKSPLKGLRRLIKRPGKPDPSLRDLDAASDAYLEFRFALMPLYNSIVDTIELLNQGLPSFEAGKIYSHQSLAGPEDEKFSWGAINTVSPLTTFRGNVSVTKRIVCNGSVQVVYAVPPGIADYLGLSVLDLPSITWELTRLSFVIDRFLAIGPWIDSLRFTPGANILGNTLGTKVEIVATVDSIERKFLWGADWHAADVPSTEITYKGYDRVVNSDLHGTPAINWALDQTFTQVLDEVALLYKALR